MRSRLGACLAAALSLVACRRAAAPPHAAARAAVTPTPPEQPAPRGTQLTLLYSSNVHGEYEPCG